MLVIHKLAECALLLLLAVNPTHFSLRWGTMDAEITNPPPNQESSYQRFPLLAGVSQKGSLCSLESLRKIPSVHWSRSELESVRKIPYVHWSRLERFLLLTGVGQKDSLCSLESVRIGVGQKDSLCSLESVRKIPSVN